ncbi:hypothetical protein [Eubacterium limosum]|uniref:dTDP-4-amino-4,6-dideoxygalactose transaminase n=1 Tax=Eubacterium limosum TaxID=1736 RepID=A0AAC9QXU5_EUBLI|nr:hypothetical protein [Eubacterium limosum]ARD67576.1 hypothetical protein B2M23_19425 [Eubacterium limosum]PWW56360.1 hypothetical protein C7955_10353 [Eubacterium limosum]UQZ23592.1 hypothetical protein M5595_04930 [Eubacterium limosum]
MKEYGGYLPLELTSKKEYYHGEDVLPLNCGRSAIYYALRDANPSKVYIPYYNCQSVIEAVKRSGVRFEFYYLNEEFEPIDIQLKKNEYILWVNYFGIFNNEKVNKLVEQYKNVIIDNTQAFYSKPNQQSYNIYSCRKFFGVSDGAYLIKKDLKIPKLEQATSYKTSIQLIKSIDLGTNKSYQEYLNAENHIFDEVKKMSKFTQKILASVDYKGIKTIRNNNFQSLHEKLRKFNQLSNRISITTQTPMVYPLLVKNKNLRKKLIENNVYVPQWWQYLIKQLEKNTFESYLSSYLFPLPIDQRYGQEDMNIISEFILKECKKECKYE